jgi:hypothetical protein
MKYDKMTPIKVTIEGGLNPDRKLELTMTPYADLSDWIDTFKTILINQTFTEDTVKELFEEPQFISDDDFDDDREDINIDCKSPQFVWKDEF